MKRVKKFIPKRKFNKGEKIVVNIKGDTFNGKIGTIEGEIWDEGKFYYRVVLRGSKKHWLLQESELLKL
jgi:hypothetical protein